MKKRQLAQVKASTDSSSSSSDSEMEANQSDRPVSGTTTSVVSGFDSPSKKQEHVSSEEEEIPQTMANPDCESGDNDNRTDVTESTGFASAKFDSTDDATF